jgi:oligoribonuclease
VKKMNNKIMNNPKINEQINEQISQQTGVKIDEKPKSADTHLVWLDMEMTGLEPEKERIIEIAFVVTDLHLNVLVEGPVFVIHQPDSILNAMDSWNKGTHGKSGLIDKVKASTVSEQQAQFEIINFLKVLIPKGKIPLCGNTIHQDRRFMDLYMPELNNFFHYRNIDVSTLKELAKRWRPDVYKNFKKQQAHTALADVYESIEELKHYRASFLKTN